VQLRLIVVLIFLSVLTYLVEELKDLYLFLLKLLLAPWLLVTLIDASLIVNHHIIIGCLFFYVTHWCAPGQVVLVMVALESGRVEVA
jgi:hypothetical protein